MPRVDLLPLVPAGLLVDAVEVNAETITVTARSAFSGSECPGCGRASGRLHSRYGRSLIDLPSHGRAVRIRLSVRRFRCIEQHCEQRIFAERLGSGIATAWARRTSRLEGLVHHVGLALGGRPAASLACRLVIPVSRDTLLRTVRRHAVVRQDPLRVVGIDDWAWKRDHRYGTILCDLERRQIVDLLPDREGATVEAWLSTRPTITTISRDRGGGYGRAASRGRPGALQIADRWHLMANASASFLQAVRRSMRPLRQAFGGPGAIDPSLLTSAERLQFEGYQRRRDIHETIGALVAEGIAIKEIVRRTGHSRKTVRQVARGGEAEIFHPRTNSLQPYLERLDAEWIGGCHNGTELWRRLRADGFRGGLRVVTEWATRRRRSERAPMATPGRLPAARAIARMMTVGRDTLSKADALTVAAIEAAVPTLVTARDLVIRFQSMVRAKRPTDLASWLSDAGGTLLASFAAGIAADHDAVLAAMSEPWSNGQTEGQITKLKLVKRQMYGRANLDLLRARLIGAT
jgi:transposase